MMLIVDTQHHQITCNLVFCHIVIHTDTHMHPTEHHSYMMSNFFLSLSLTKSCLINWMIISRSIFTFNYVNVRTRCDVVGANFLFSICRYYLILRSLGCSFVVHVVWHCGTMSPLNNFNDNKIIRFAWKWMRERENGKEIKRWRTTSMEKYKLHVRTHTHTTHWLTAVCSVRVEAYLAKVIWI